LLAEEDLAVGKDGNVVEGAILAGREKVAGGLAGGGVDLVSSDEGVDDAGLVLAG
jgi:hypothetical protein